MHTISWRRRLAAALVLPFLLVLAGCGRFVGEVEVKNADELYIKMDFAIKKDQLDGLYSSADELCKAADENGEAATKGVKIEPYEEDGMYGCRAEGPSNREDFSSSFDLTEKDGKYHLSMKGDSTPITEDDLALINAGDFDFSMTFTFPGKVTESKAGTIDGNSVKYTSLQEFSKGVDITAEASGFPWLIVIIAVLVIGFLLLLVLAAVIFFVIRSRRNKGPKVGAATSTPYAAGAAPQTAGFDGSPAAGSSAVPPAPGAAAPGTPSAPAQASPYGQPSPAPQGGDFGGQQPGGWGQPPQQGEQPGQQSGAWGQPPQNGQPGQQPGQQPGGWGQPPQNGQPGQPGQQPPQNPGW